MSWVTYAVSDGTAIKFGKSTAGRLAQRVMTLQIGNPRPLMVLAVCPYEGRFTEPAVHAALRSVGEHVRGEWFSGPLSQNMVREMKAHAGERRPRGSRRADLSAVLGAEWRSGVAPR